ncbi:MAG: hypothetical protein V7609_2689 [Verrucomicrobiota bacterium]
MSVGPAVELDVPLNRVLDVFESFVDIRALRMTTRQLRAAHRNTFVVGQERDMKFPLHVNSTYVRRARQSIMRHLYGFCD